MMPEMDGIEATRIIRNECGEATKKSVIIALTANALQGAKEEFLQTDLRIFYLNLSSVRICMQY